MSLSQVGATPPSSAMNGTRRRVFAVVIAALFGCSSKEAPEPSISSTARPNRDAGVLVKPPPPPEAPKVALVPTAPGARIELSLLGRYKDPAFGAANLPGVSEDGARVAYGEQRLDGGRGSPNYRLVVRDIARDRPVVSKEILAPSPSWRPELEQAVRARIGAANQLLAESDWQPMKPMYVTAERPGVLESGDDQLRIRGVTLELSRNGRLRTRRPLTRLLLTNAGCPGTARLSEAYIRGARLLVRFEFDTDGCWREAEYHALLIR